jgi:hypothetical protein
VRRRASPNRNQQILAHFLNESFDQKPSVFRRVRGRLHARQGRYVSAGHESILASDIMARDRIGAIDVRWAAKRNEGMQRTKSPMHLVLPAISLLLAQADPAHRTESSWPADFYASFTGGGFHQPEAYDGWQAGGGVGANWYLRNPLVDDGSPLSMQAFLQRLDRLSFDVSAVGTYSTGTYPTMVTGLGTIGVVVRAPERYRGQVTSPLADPLATDDAQ